MSADTDSTRPAPDDAAAVQSANDSGELVTVAWYEDLQGGYGELVGLADLVGHRP
jgi:hypothetical protein